MQLAKGRLDLDTARCAGRVRRFTPTSPCVGDLPGRQAVADADLPLAQGCNPAVVRRDQTGDAFVAVDLGEQVIHPIGRVRVQIFRSVRRAAPVRAGSSMRAPLRRVAFARPPVEGSIRSCGDAECRVWLGPNSFDRAFDKARAFPIPPTLDIDLLSPPRISQKRLMLGDAALTRAKCLQKDNHRFSPQRLQYRPKLFCMKNGRSGCQVEMPDACSGVRPVSRSVSFGRLASLQLWVCAVSTLSTEDRNRPSQRVIHVRTVAPAKSPGFVGRVP